MAKFIIECKDVIPESSIIKNFLDISSTNLTFGVHQEDNDTHYKRDSLQQKPLHSAFYKNKSSIGNAELLKMHTNGFKTQVFINNKLTDFKVPKRPILQPMVKEIFKKKFPQFILKNGIRKQLQHFGGNYTYDAFNTLSNYFYPDQVKDFVSNKGKGYWESENNSVYVAAIKAVETYNTTRINKLYDKKKQTINSKDKWYKIKNQVSVGDTPLIDSQDLINSIKVKVEK